MDGRLLKTHLLLLFTCSRILTDSPTDCLYAKCIPSVILLAFHFLLADVLSRVLPKSSGVLEALPAPENSYGFRLFLGNLLIPQYCSIITSCVMAELEKLGPK
jgi:hypothetical protein